MTDSKPSVARAIEDKLTAALAPVRLDLVDESHRHAGHAGARPAGESHFRLEVVSKAFEGKTPVARQQMVYNALAAEFAAGLHALSMTTLTPSEDV